MARDKEEIEESLHRKKSDSVTLRTELTMRRTSKGYFLPMKALLDWCDRTTPCVIVKHCINCDDSADNSACFSSAQPSNEPTDTLKHSIYDLRPRWRRDSRRTVAPDIQNNSLDGTDHPRLFI